MKGKWMIAVLSLALVVGLFGGGSVIAAPDAPLAVTAYISDDVGPDNVSNRTAADALDDTWRSAATSAGANGFHQITLSGATVDQKIIWTSGGGFTAQVSNREMTTTDMSTANSVGSQNGTYELSSSNTLQDEAPRPASLYSSGSQPLFWNQTGGSTATRNAILFTFSAPISAFGAWFGDLETRTDGNGVAAIVRLLDGSGNRIGGDIIVTTSTSPQSSCGGTFAGCGNRSTKWVGFVATSDTRVKQMLVVVGDDDNGGNALAERISFIGATVALYGSEPLSVTLAEFYAAQQADAILVTWETASELGNRGFNLYRGTSPAGWDRQLNAALIPSQSQGSPGGFVYTWEDRADLVPGVTYYYWLQDVDTSGAMTMHGPVSVDFGVPTAVTLGGVDASPVAGAAALPWLAVVAGAGVALALGRRR